MRQKISIVVGLALYSQLSVADVSVPISHLQEKNLTDEYTKSLVSNLKGYVQVGDVRVPSQISSRSAPATLITTKDGKQYLKVGMSGVAESDNKKKIISGYGLLDKQSMLPVKTVMSDGEITFYRSVKDYPANMNVGGKTVISKSETYSHSDSKTPSYKTTEILSLERVGGERDLFELCETDYEYSRESGYKKTQAENSSCYIINSQGELKGYAALLVDQTSRSTFQGTVSVE